jgi:drug/metabolite transporter (DMT)-like permease
MIDLRANEREADHVRTDFRNTLALIPHMTLCTEPEPPPVKVKPHVAGSNTHPSPRRPPMLLILAAFAAIYFIWGSTYLGIRWAIDAIPPFFMAGTRFVIAGLLLGGFLVLRGERLPTTRQWRNTLILGILLLACGNGTVTWAEQYVTSGVAALFVAIVPVWMVLLNMVIAGPNGLRSGPPRIGVIIGLILGVAGMVLLVRGQNGDFAGLGAGTMPKLAALALLGSTLGWSLGSVLSRRIDLPASALMSTAAQMLTGGIVMVAISAGRGEFAHVSLARLTWAAVLSHAYLIIFGSIIAFTAYTWLLQKVSPARVSTYAYVSPVVAVLLGWFLQNEPMNAMTGIAAAVILAGVALIVTPRRMRTVGTGSSLAR